MSKETEPMYRLDAYAKEFDAVVTAVDTERGGVYLDRTAFYPGGGGQPCDHGVLSVQRAGPGAGEGAERGAQAPSAAASAPGAVRGGAPVELPVTAVEKGHLHIVEGELPEVGTPVRGQIDWDHRFALMRTHTAFHILCGVVWRDYGAQVTGGNMAPLSGRMDFEFERLDRELITKIEASVNAEVDAAREVRARILPREEAEQIPDLIRTKVNLLPQGITEIRTIEIEGLDLQADGGTHVANTGEVGAIRLPKFKNKGGINKRIYLELPE